MKFEVLRENFYRGVSTVSKTAPVKPTTPVLGNLLMDAVSNGLEITGTDLETTIKVRVAAKTTDKGKTTVPARLLAELLGTLEGDKITAVYEKETLMFKTDRVSAKMPTISASEFPTLPEIEKTKGNKIDRQSFLQSVKEVSAASAQDDGRPVLTGVLFKPGKDSTLLVATDGYRLAKKETVKMVNDEVIIPARSLGEVGKILSESEDESLSIGVAKEENQVVFSLEHIEYFTKLIAGEFPNFEQIIPKEFVTNVVLDKEKFLNGIKTVSTFAKELGSVVHLSLGDGASKISASSSQVGEGEASFDSKVEGEAIKIAFNGRYLAEGIGVLSGEKVEMQFAGPTKPALIKKPGDPSFIYIVMPVRTQS